MKLSIGMMVKNEAQNLERCLNSIKPLLEAVESELIIVDTGSEDNTVEIAKRYTDKIYYHEWNDHFGEMRNKTIAYATGEWFFVIDADEELENPQPIIDFLLMKECKEFSAGVMFVKNITTDREIAGFSTMLSPRLFRRTKKLRYEGAVHHQVVFSGAIFNLQTCLLHYGYRADDPELMERKFLRTSRILKSELEKEPENLYYLYQLSVTYGMHKDFDLAIETIERAYGIFCKLHKPKRYMFVLVHRAMMYQMTGNYKSLEKACLEALAVSEGYLDVYYYLAEAYAAQKQPEKAIENYKKYLEIVEGYNEFTEKDGAVIDYTLANKELALSNLAVLCKAVEDYESALAYAKQVTVKNLVQDNLPNIVYLFIKMGNYQQLRDYYETVVDEGDRCRFYEIVEEVKNNFGFGRSEIIKIAETFSDLDNEYGLLQCLVLAVECGVNDLPEIETLDLTKLMTCAKDVFYYLIKLGYPLQTMVPKFKELCLNVLADTAAKRHNDFPQELLKYWRTLSYEESAISQCKLYKAICRYLLLMNNLDNAEYENVFQAYLKAGTQYLKLVYSEKVLREAWLQELKNDEEVFLLCMQQAAMTAEGSAAYVSWLRQALEVMPSFKRAIVGLLERLQSRDREFEEHQRQIKSQIRSLASQRKIAEAQKLLSEYKEIVPNDLEAVLLESELLLQ